TSDETLVARRRLVDVGDVLSSFVERGCARRGDAVARGARRYRKVEDEVRPEQRLVELEHLVEIEPARHITGQPGEQEPVGDDELAVPQRRKHDILDPVSEI